LIQSVARAGLLGLALIVGGVSAAGAQEDVHHVPIDVMLAQPVEAPDGVALAATVWTPTAGRQKFTTVLVVTPYISDEAHDRARTYADRGYAMVSVDRRGRGNSGGPHQVFTDVGPDACAVIEWIRSQPWSDGRVVMRGGSYRGMTQWMTARTCPDALSTMIPTAAAYPGEDFPRTGAHGAYSYLVRWLALTYGRTGNDKLFADDQYWSDKFDSAYLNYVPFAELDRWVGMPSPLFQRWVAGLSDVPDFSDVTPTPQQYRRITMPVLTVTGHYDGDQPGALRYYREHVAEAPDVAAAEHFLLIGPWDHGDTRRPTAELGSSGAVEFGANSVFDMDQFNLDWFDWRLGRGEKPELLKDRVTYYVGGADEWRHAPALDAIAGQRRKLYLSGEAYEAYEGFRSGQLAEQVPSKSVVHTFTSDPLDTSALAVTETDHFAMIAKGEIDDPSPGYLPQTLTFHSARFDQPTTIAGRLKLTLYLSLDTPDADVRANVFAVFPDGTVRLLGSDVVRARFRHGSPQPVPPGVVEPYVFERFFWQAFEVSKGALLRLTVGPLNDPSMQKNFNSGGRPGFETREDARVATIQLHHDAQYPSHLEIPIATLPSAVGPADEHQGDAP
jgi:putative CocE/NonD family hydrolase